MTTGAQRTAKNVFLSGACTSAAARRAQTTRLPQRKWRGTSSCRLLALPNTGPSKGQGGHRALEEIRCTTVFEQEYKEIVDYSEPSKSPMDLLLRLTMLSFIAPLLGNFCPNKEFFPLVYCLSCFFFSLETLSDFLLSVTMVILMILVWIKHGIIQPCGICQMCKILC